MPNIALYYCCLYDMRSLDQTSFVMATQISMSTEASLSAAAAAAMSKLVIKHVRETLVKNHYRDTL